MTALQAPDPHQFAAEPLQTLLRRSEGAPDAAVLAGEIFRGVPGHVLLAEQYPLAVPQAIDALPGVRDRFSEARRGLLGVVERAPAGRAECGRDQDAEFEQSGHRLYLPAMDMDERDRSSARSGAPATASPSRAMDAPGGAVTATPPSNEHLLADKELIESWSLPQESARRAMAVIAALRPKHPNIRYFVFPRNLETWETRWAHEWFERTLERGRPARVAWTVSIVSVVILLLLGAGAEAAEHPLTMIVVAAYFATVGRFVAVVPYFLFCGVAGFVLDIVERNACGRVPAALALPPGDPGRLHCWDKRGPEGKWSYWWSRRAEAHFALVIWVAGTLLLLWAEFAGWGPRWGDEGDGMLDTLLDVATGSVLLWPFFALLLGIPYLVCWGIVGVILSIAEHIAYARGYRYGRDKLGY